MNSKSPVALRPEAMQLLGYGGFDRVAPTPVTLLGSQQPGDANQYHTRKCSGWLEDQ